ncbi:hypothetical protein ACIA49_00305 [Kribbella sp. NPDC051587]|uniref:hypothetical protein n=1 Tax=Kribbella sp. NPDC051587 TaxID=3364119 RepID=UPI00379C67C1
MYSQIAGVLAGFAFTALLGFLRHGASEEDGEDGPTADYTLSSVSVVLFSTITALIISAILYGILAGGLPASGSSFSIVFIDGPAFSLAILGMFYAIGLAASQYSHMGPMLTAVRILMGVVGPAIAMLLIATAVLDIYHFYCKFNEIPNKCDDVAQLSPAEPFGLGVWLTALGLAVSIVLCFRFRRPPAHRPVWIPTVISCVVFGTAVVAVLGVVVLDSFPSTYVLSDWILRVGISVVFVMVSIVSILTMWSCHPPAPSGTRSPPAPEPSPSGAPDGTLAPSTAEIGRSELASRYSGYLTAHYLDLHVTVVSVALGVGGLSAAGLLASTDSLHGWAYAHWTMWLASLLAVATVYAGTMTGAIGLPARIPTVSDLLIPTLLAVVEVLMFGVLVSQIIGFDSRRSVVVVWFFLLGIFGLMAATAVLRASRYFVSGAYAADIRQTVDAYRVRMKRDAVSAGALAVLGIAGGLANLLSTDGLVMTSSVLATVVTCGFVVALVGHNQSAQLWRRGLSDDRASAGIKGAANA